MISDFSLVVRIPVYSKSLQDREFFSRFLVWLRLGAFAPSFDGFTRNSVFASIMIFSGKVFRRSLIWGLNRTIRRTTVWYRILDEIWITAVSSLLIHYPNPVIFIFIFMCEQRELSRSSALLCNRYTSWIIIPLGLFAIGCGFLVKTFLLFVIPKFVRTKNKF